METTVENLQTGSDAQKQRRMLAKGLVRALNEIKRLEKALYNDELTGIANLKAFEDKLPQLVELAHDKKEPLALLIADVDGLKRTNDQLGHDAGNRLLKKVGEAFSKIARPSDWVGRLHGDEFYAILPGFHPMAGQSEEELVDARTEWFSSTFQSALEELDLPDELRLNVSFGIAILQSDESPAELQKRADAICMANKAVRKADLAKAGNNFTDDRL